MKTMSCIDCGKGNFEAGTPEEMMQVMMPHYREAHAEMMAGQSKESHEEWMKRFHEAWESIEEL